MRQQRRTSDANNPVCRANVSFARFAIYTAIQPHQPYIVRYHAPLLHAQSSNLCRRVWVWERSSQASICKLKCYSRAEDYSYTHHVRHLGLEHRNCAATIIVVGSGLNKKETAESSTRQSLKDQGVIMGADPLCEAASLRIRF